MANGRGNKGTTLTDVAVASGLSASAVSLALRGKSGVSEETRARIAHIAQELGYQKAAPSSRRSRTARTVGLVIRSIQGDTPQENVFYGPVMVGIAEGCRAHHLRLMLGTMVMGDNYCPVEFPPIVTDRSCNGLIVVGGVISAANEAVLRASHPTVLVDAYADSNTFDSVVIDNVRGAQTAVEHLISLGHREIAILGTAPDAFPSIVDRRRGYERAIAGAGLPGHYIDVAYSPPEEVAAASMAYLRAHPEVTAVFCAYDAVAMILLQAASENGIPVPGRLSVVGFDDIDVAGHLSPPLTTMAVDKVGMGRLAVTLVAHRMEFPKGSVTETLFHTTLVQRGSSGPAPDTGVAGVAGVAEVAGVKSAFPEPEIV